jgi:hypothetical protein
LARIINLQFLFIKLLMIWVHENSVAYKDQGT